MTVYVLHGHGSDAVAVLLDDPAFSRVDGVLRLRRYRLGLGAHGMSDLTPEADPRIMLVLTSRGPMRKSRYTEE